LLCEFLEIWGNDPVRQCLDDSFQDQDQNRTPLTFQERQDPHDPPSILLYSSPIHITMKNHQQVSSRSHPLQVSTSNTFHLLSLPSLSDDQRHKTLQDILSEALRIAEEADTQDAQQRDRS
jgi:hypothetical protein